MTRIKDWKVEDLTKEQKEIHDTIVSGPRGHVVGPLRIWLNNPGLAKSAQTVGEYARYGTSLSKGLSELAIITTGRVWSSAFEWEHHAPLAIEGGIDPHHVDIISQGKRPNFIKPEEEAVFEVEEEVGKEGLTWDQRDSLRSLIDNRSDSLEKFYLINLALENRYKF